ncbi:MAG: hypothetical protein AAFX87_20105 [Bacteroidota bacterium]
MKKNIVIAILSLGVILLFLFAKVQQLEAERSRDEAVNIYMRCQDVESKLEDEIKALKAKLDSIQLLSE